MTSASAAPRRPRPGSRPDAEYEQRRHRDHDHRARHRDHRGRAHVAAAAQHVREAVRQPDERRSAEHDVRILERAREALRRCPPRSRYKAGPKTSAASVKLAPRPSAISTACQASASASAWRWPPSALAIAEEMPPPMAPADIICISITIGNTSVTPASASVPRRPTK